MQKHHSFYTKDILGKHTQLASEHLATLVEEAIFMLTPAWAHKKLIAALEDDSTELRQAVHSLGITLRVVNTVQRSTYAFYYKNKRVVVFCLYTSNGVEVSRTALQKRDNLDHTLWHDITYKK